MDEPVPPRLQKRQLRLRVHSVRDDDERVSASVFANKLSSLVKALRAADKALNGKPRHDYFIAKLSSSNPTAVLSEVDILTLRHPYGIHDWSFISAIGGFNDCANAIISGDRERALRYGNCAHHIAKLAQGSQKSFSYAEVWTDNDNIVRVDDLLVHKARGVISEGRPVQYDRAGEDIQPWFSGTAYGTFDGTIKEVDLRGSLPEVKLILSAGGKEIDCVFKQDDLEKIRTAINRRCRIYGSAIYDGKSGLPLRINIVDIQPVTSGGDLSAWANSFEPYELPDWDEDLE